MKDVGIQLEKYHLRIVKEASQDGAVVDLGLVVVVVVVGHLVNLRAGDFEGATCLGHHKKHHENHSGRTRHRWSLKICFVDLSRKHNIGILDLEDE